MRILTFATVSMLAMAAPALASEPTFELRLDQSNGQRTVAVANEKSGAYAVAAGGEDLSVLEGSQAEEAFKRLRAMPGADIDFHDADREHDGKGNRKIVVHKMDYDEDSWGDDDTREVRIIKRRKSDPMPGEEIEIEDEADAADDIDLDLPDDGSSSSERRLLYINAADEKAAVKFIDRIKGLDDSEKSAMKEAVGL